MQGLRIGRESGDKATMAQACRCRVKHSKFGLHQLFLQNEEFTRPARSGARRRLAQRDLTGQGVVMVVDDEDTVRRTVKTALQRYGYSVLLAENGQDAVDLFREVHDRVAGAILDMTMPVMGGEDALRHIKTIDPDVPVILSSGFNEVEAIRRFTGKGLAGFIQKPYTARALAAKLKQVRESPETI